MNNFWLDVKKKTTSVWLDTHDYDIEQLCVCDCFLESTLAFHTKVFCSQSYEEIKNSIREILRNPSTAAKKFFSLIGR